jgi:hypothetical protein
MRMNFIKCLAAMGLSLALVACGGGGGSAGTPSGGTSSTGGTTGTGGTTVVGTAETLLTAQLKDTVTGATVNSVAAGGGTEIVATLITKDGKGVANQTVAVNNDAEQLLFYPNGSSAKTDVNGVARISVKRSNLYEFGTATFYLIFESTDVYSQALSGVIQYRVDPPPLQLELRDTSNAVTNTIGASGLSTLKATLKFPDGTPVAQKRIDITGDLTKVAFPEGSSQLTDTNGIATIKVSRASATVGGAGTLSGAATISGTSTSGSSVSTVVTGTVDYSVGAVVGAATLSLDTLDVGAATLAAYGTRQISVRAMLGASVAPSVQVSFSSNCGQISPATAPTNANGIAVASFTATDVAGTAVSTLGCGGKTVDISVSAVGASVQSKSLSILEAPATNLSFVVPVDLTKSRIYLTNSGGATQTPVEFLLSNARGEPIPGKDVLVSLKSLNGGIPKATFVTVGNTDSKTLTTDSFGKIAVPVFSGTIPTNVLVNAALVSNPLVQTDSSVVVIASGRPAQARVSLVRGKSAIRGFDYDGSTTTVTMSLADRQGNPVPDGTAVNFVTEGGVMIPPTCVTGAVPGDSQCSVNIRTQNPRPSNGLVSILAYAAGEEDFVDVNFNNVFDCGESYTDLVTAYRDDTAIGLQATNPAWGVPNAFVTGEFTVPRSSSASTCATGAAPSPNAGDGVWGAADVRGQVLVVFSTDDFEISNPQWVSAVDTNWSSAVVTTQLKVVIQDMKGRSVPTGSTISVSVQDNSPKAPSDGGVPIATIGGCSLVSQSHTAVPDSLGPLSLTLSLKQCVPGDLINVTLTTPAQAVTYTFTPQ